MDDLKYYAVYVEFDENNSGGYWRLSSQDYQKLEAAGWVVDYPDPLERRRGRTATTVQFVWARSEDEADTIGGDLAKRHWEIVLGRNAGEPGCFCCGRPFLFMVDKVERVEIECDYGKDDDHGDVH